MNYIFGMLNFLETMALVFIESKIKSWLTEGWWPFKQASIIKNVKPMGLYRWVKFDEYVNPWFTAIFRQWTNKKLTKFAPRYKPFTRIVNFTIRMTPIWTSWFLCWPFPPSPSDGPKLPFTSLFQAICMFGSFLAIIIKGNEDIGGTQVVWDRNYDSGRIELFNFNPDLRRRHTFWGLLIGGFFTWISIYGINQTQVQRYLTARKTSQAVK